MDHITKAQLPNPKFRRLFWASDKKKINEILSTVNIKYLLGLKNKIYKTDKGSKGTRMFIRYSGYEFQVSSITINKELNRRKNESNIS